MPLDLAAAANECADWASTVPVLRAVALSPVFTALFLAALVAVIALALYRPQLQQAGWARAVKGLVYVTIAAGVTLFLHYYVAGACAARTADQRARDDVFDRLSRAEPVLGGAAAYAAPCAAALGGAGAAWGALGGGAAARSAAAPPDGLVPARADNVADAAPGRIRPAHVPDVL